MKTDKIILLTVIVSALGYFVDIYDLLLFSIVRTPSLKALGIPDAQTLNEGIHLLNAQMAGMLLGGIAWGILGDKHGRKSVLFGSILLYSLANIANAFVTDTTTYAVLRFLAGFGLAGELGAAVTLVSEIMTPKNRGYGTALVAGIGILGAVLASLIGDLFDWKIAYIVGGVMGLALLALRAGLLESEMFRKMSIHETIPRGAFLKLISSRKTLFKYLRCIFIGAPFWFAVGILVTFSPEIAKEFGVVGQVTASHAILWNYLSCAIGGLFCGFLSQYLQGRKSTILIFISLNLVLFSIYIFERGISSEMFYGLCALLGFASGYWSVFVTNAAEQFGTNMRATAAITVPNFVRGMVVPMTISFRALQTHSGTVTGLTVVGGVTILLAYVSLFGLEETYAKDLNSIEEF